MKPVLTEAKTVHFDLRDCVTPIIFWLFLRMRKPSVYMWTIIFINV